MELGTCEAIIGAIKTLKDGSVKIELELNPSDQSLISKLMNQFLLNKRLVTVAFVAAQ